MDYLIWMVVGAALGFIVGVCAHPSDETMAAITDTAQETDWRSAAFREGKARL